MKLENFKSGNYVKYDTYKAFVPHLINHSWEWDSAEISYKLEKASAELGGLNSFSELIPNVDTYIKMHIRTEANKSSRIEGTKTTIEEDLYAVEYLSPEKRDDHEEVNNYIKSLNYAILRLKSFPLCNRLLCEMHAILMQGVRGKSKSPGEFRQSQNWIGGSMPSNALYVPPHISNLGELLSDFEKFIHNDDYSTPHLIKAAILHYQFETIHPFLDGNGRIGRILIQIYLLEKKVIEKPCFYISDYLEKHRNAYYDALDRVRTHNDISHWVKFFLDATIYTAQTAKTKFKNVVKLVEIYKKTMFAFNGKGDKNLKILELFFDSPILSGREIQQATGISQPAVDKCLKQMIAAKMLTEVTGYNRNRIYLLEEYIEIFGRENETLL